MLRTPEHRSAATTPLPPTNTGQQAKKLKIIQHPQLFFFSFLQQTAMCRTRLPSDIAPTCTFKRTYYLGYSRVIPMSSKPWWCGGLFASSAAVLWSRLSAAVFLVCLCAAAAGGPPAVVYRVEGGGGGSATVPPGEENNPGFLPEPTRQIITCNNRLQVIQILENYRLFSEDCFTAL